MLQEFDDFWMSVLQGGSQRREPATGDLGLKSFPLLLSCGRLGVHVLGFADLGEVGVQGYGLQLEASRCSHLQFQLLLIPRQCSNWNLRTQTSGLGPESSFT